MKGGASAAETAAAAAVRRRSGLNWSTGKAIRLRAAFPPDREYARTPAASSVEPKRRATPILSRAGVTDSRPSEKCRRPEQPSPDRTRQREPRGRLHRFSPTSCDVPRTLLVLQHVFENVLALRLGGAVVARLALLFALQTRAHITFGTAPYQRDDLGGHAAAVIRRRISSNVSHRCAMLPASAPRDVLIPSRRRCLVCATDLAQDVGDSGGEARLAHVCGLLGGLVEV